jgi:hypothetical protein
MGFKRVSAGIVGLLLAGTAGATGATGAAGATGPAGRSIYVCTDAGGKRITSDRPPPECAGREIRELRSDGSIKRVIEPPIAPAQRAAREAEEARKKEAAEKQREQTRRDLALLETYASVKEVEAARTRALASRQTIIERAQARKKQLVAQRKKIDLEAEFYAKRELPDKLKRAYADNDALQHTEDRIIADTQAEITRINASFDADAKRFHELEEAGAVNRPLAPAKK